MADAYRVKQDVSFPRVISKIKGEGDDAEYQIEGVNYIGGSFILAKNMTPRDRARAESGELDDLLEPASLEDVQAYGAEEPELGVFIAEHEAEAHALEQYGHHVVPKEQELEALSRSAPHAAEYQQAVKDAGLDRRPAQEAMAQSRERIPDEVLHGAETRTGTPHNRGSVEESNDEEQDEQSHAARPRPGTSEQNTQESPDQSDTESSGWK